jgi:hypothetical protein
MARLTGRNEDSPSPQHGRSHSLGGTQHIDFPEERTRQPEAELPQ